MEMIYGNKIIHEFFSCNQSHDNISAINIPSILQVDGATLDGRLWPRAAAMAERLWSNPASSWRDAEYRFLHQRERLVEIGLSAESIEPEWCYQNDGLCGDRN